MTLFAQYISKQRHYFSSLNPRKTDITFKSYKCIAFLQDVLIIQPSALGYNIVGYYSEALVKK